MRCGSAGMMSKQEQRSLSTKERIEGAPGMCGEQAASTLLVVMCLGAAAVIGGLVWLMRRVYE